MGKGKTENKISLQTFLISEINCFIHDELCDLLLKNEICNLIFSKCLTHSSYPFTKPVLFPHSGHDTIHSFGLCLNSTIGSGKK